jgi:hypothetical protein
MFEKLTADEANTLHEMLDDGIRVSCYEERRVTDLARRLPSASARRELFKSVKGFAEVRSEIRALLWDVKSVAS